MKKVKLIEFIPDPHNANRGTQRGRGMLENSLQELGAGRSVLADKNGVLIAGNKTLQTAVESGFEDAIVVETDGTKLVVVKRTDLDLTSDDKAKKLAIADNRVGEISLDWDPQVLEELSQEIDLSGLFTDDELSYLIEPPEIEEPQVSAEEDEETTADLIDKAESGQIESRVKPGQIWALGRHRIACGDSTDEANVRKLLGDRKVDMIFTDPPYSVSYADKNKSLNASDKGNRVQTPIENDHLSPEETFETIWLPAFRNLFDHAKPGCAYYVTAPQGGEQMMMMMMALKESGWLVKHELIWVKNNHVLGRADYHYKHEPIIYGWKPGAAHYFRDSRSEMSVWNFDKPQKSELHPTMKPVELIVYALENSSRSEDLVADFFLGSGSTLVACEQTGRTCYGTELSPAYTSVVVERWERFTGKKAELVGVL